MPVIVPPVEYEVTSSRLAPDVRLAPTMCQLLSRMYRNARVVWDNGLTGLRPIVHHDQLACSIVLAEKILDRLGWEAETMVGEEQTGDGGGQSVGSVGD